MYTLQIQNDRGEIYGLTDHLDEFIVTEITGLDSPRNNINISTAGTQDGGKFNSSHLECRNIVITVVLSGNIEAQRQKLYRIFPIKSAVKVFFREKYRNLMTEGYIEQISVPQFVKLEVAQISIICPDPYWKDRNEIQAETSYGLAAFAFPFAISAGGVPLSGQYANPVCRIVNNGDCDIGFVSRITVDTEQEATITRQTTSFTVSSILSRRVLLPLSASEYDESTEHLRVKINGSVIEPSRYTTKYMQHLGIDYADEAVTANVTTAVAAAEQTLKGAVGDDVDSLLPGDPRAKQLALLYVDDYYDEHGLTAASGKQSSAHRGQVTVLEWQLKLELRRLREAGT